MTRTPAPPRPGQKTPHRLNVDGFLLPPPGGGTLLLFSCPTCRFHARVTCARESAQDLADLLVQAHLTAERATEDGALCRP